MRIKVAELSTMQAENDLIEPIKVNMDWVWYIMKDIRGSGRQIYGE